MTMKTTKTIHRVALPEAASARGRTITMKRVPRKRAVTRNQERKRIVTNLDLSLERLIGKKSPKSNQPNSLSVDQYTILKKDLIIEIIQELGSLFISLYISSCHT